MTVELRNAPQLHEPIGYSHASIALPGRIVHLAGQGGADREGRVEGSLATQTERAMLNLGLALEAAGGAPEHLVKLTLLVVDWSELKMNDLLEGLLAAAQVQPVPAVPITLHGVSGLFLDAMVVEVEGIAVLPPGSDRDPELAAQW